MFTRNSRRRTQCYSLNHQGRLQACSSLGSESIAKLSRRTESARVLIIYTKYQTSVRHPGQKVGLDHVLEDEDVVTFFRR